MNFPEFKTLCMLTGNVWALTVRLGLQEQQEFARRHHLVVQARQVHLLEFRGHVGFGYNLRRWIDLGPKSSRVQLDAPVRGVP